MAAVMSLHPNRPARQGGASIQCAPAWIVSAVGIRTPGALKWLERGALQIPADVTLSGDRRRSVGSETSSLADCGDIRRGGLAEWSMAVVLKESLRNWAHSASGSTARPSSQSGLNSRGSAIPEFNPITDHPFGAIAVPPNQPRSADPDRYTPVAQVVRSPDAHNYQPHYHPGSGATYFPRSRGSFAPSILLKPLPVRQAALLSAWATPSSTATHRRFRTAHPVNHACGLARKGSDLACVRDAGPAQGAPRGAVRLE